MEALVIVDMQMGCFKPYSSRYNTFGVVEQINLLSSFFRDSNRLVIYIKHNGAKEGYLYPNTRDFDLLDELIQSPSDICIVKEANDAFYSTNLDDLLKEKGVEKLYFCGLASNFCLDATIKSALNKDYKIYVASDAHTTGDNPYFKANEMIEYHNWLWANLTPTKYGITVCPAQKIIDELMIE